MPEQETTDVTLVKQSGSKLGFQTYLNQIIADVKKVADSLKATDSSDQLQKISSALLNFDSEVKVGLFGLTNSGKSAVLNALLGNNFLPMSEQRQSVCPVRIQHDPHLNSPGHLFALKEASGDYLTSGVESIHTNVEELNKEDRLRGSTKIW